VLTASSTGFNGLCRSGHSGFYFARDTVCVSNTVIETINEDAKGGNSNK
jgi:hypothetical protein